MPTATKQKTIGEVIHYYDKLGVAILKLASPIKVGDVVLFLRRGQEFLQNVSSLQIEHESVDKAKKGEIVGLKVDQPVKEGTMVVAT